MKAETMALCATVALAGCWPDLEPLPAGEPDGGGGAEPRCELQADCGDGAEVLVCGAGDCWGPGELPCATDNDCGAMGWCYLVAEGCTHGDPESCEGGTEGYCLPEDVRHCRQDGELSDCTGADMVCCERLDSGTHECAAEADCLDDHVLTNPRRCSSGTHSRLPAGQDCDTRGLRPTSHEPLCGDIPIRVGEEDSRAQRALAALPKRAPLPQRSADRRRPVGARAS